MATTYTLIDSEVLSSSQASITFSSIPATYTDLVVRWSARSDNTATDSIGLFQIMINSDAGGNYSRIALTGNGSTASSFNSGAGSGVIYQNAGNVASNGTASTFSNGELYIPSYTVSQKKPMGGFSVTENNATAAGIGTIAGLWQGTAAITAINISSAAGNLVSGSSIYLYGISNA